MLRIYFRQQWFDLSDPQAEDAIYDSESMRRFARVELAEDEVSDESTILRFRHLLEPQGLTEAIFEAVKDLLIEHGLLLRAGTIVAATIIAAPSSTKSATGKRDPERKQTRKGQAWHFGMELHVGTDRRGTVHSVTATHAAASDLQQMPDLLHGEESVIYGDQADWKEADRLSDACPLRARLSDREAAWGLRRDALPGDRKEPGPRADHVRAGQSLRPAPPTDATGGGVRPVIGETRPGWPRPPRRGGGGVTDRLQHPASGPLRARCAELP